MQVKLLLTGASAAPLAATHLLASSQARTLTQMGTARLKKKSDLAGNSAKPKAWFAGDCPWGERTTLQGAAVTQATFLLVGIKALTVSVKIPQRGFRQSKKVQKV